MDKQEIFWELCNVQPRFQYLPEFDPKPNTAWYGIKALWFEGTAYSGQKTKVFAYIGYPKEAEFEKVPAVVLVHGGEGHAFPEWIKKWNEKGFAAIAMDTTGYFPNEAWRGLVGTEEGTAKDKYDRRLYGQLAEEGYTVGPDNVDMRTDVALPLQEQWMYHAVADTILAHNILRQDERIDSERIGICGISWGGVITSIAIGYDTRYSFAIPIYGSAYLGVSSESVLDKVFRQENIKRLWSAEDRLHHVNFPVLWLCWRDDPLFSITGHRMSYERTKDSGSILSINPNMGHGHISAWVVQEPYDFATNIVNDENIKNKKIDN